MFLPSDPLGVIASPFKVTKNCGVSVQRCMCPFPSFIKRALKLLSPAQTHWLFLQECVNRPFELYEALTHYFVLAVNKDPSHSNDRILASLQNRFIQAYLQFLSFQLEPFNAFNWLFQSEKPYLHNLKQEVQRLIKSIVSDFMKVSMVKTMQPKNLNPAHLQHRLPLR